jgi:hypothetical protein
MGPKTMQTLTQLLLRESEFWLAVLAQKPRERRESTHTM